MTLDPKNSIESPDQMAMRPEARPVGIEGWSKSQKAAGSRILGIMEACVHEANFPRNATENKAPGEHEIDPKRSSRVIFLSGERGMGKTTLLLSIMRVIAAGGEELEKLRRGSSRLKDRVKWLQILDLEPLPHPTNLLVSLLCRLENLTKTLNEPGVRPGVRPRVFRDDDDLLSNFRELKTKVSLAWNGNLPERAAELDPDVFAPETVRAEEARLSLNKSFSELLERLAGFFSDDAERRPIFVLPVDDLDLNPVRAIELMQLLRFLTTPRLLVLILGHESMLEQVVKLRKEGELCKLIGRGSKDSREKASEMAQTLAATSMRKLIRVQVPICRAIGAEIWRQCA